MVMSTMTTAEDAPHRLDLDFKLSGRGWLGWDFGIMFDWIVQYVLVNEQVSCVTSSSGVEEP